jgi:hypothetical protein
MTQRAGQLRGDRVDRASTDLLRFVAPCLHGCLRRGGHRLRDRGRAGRDQQLAVRARECRRGVRSRRIATHPAVWNRTIVVSRWPGTDADREQFVRLHEDLPRWYYAGGGLYLSTRARKRYEHLQLGGPVERVTQADSAADLTQNGSSCPKHAVLYPGSQVTSASQASSLAMTPRRTSLGARSPMSSPWRARSRQSTTVRGRRSSSSVPIRREPSSP